jgi:hypothetical protein
MLLARRYRSLALLLIIVISYAAFSAHAVTHTTGDLSGCELCAGHGDPTHAIPVSPQGLSAPVSAYFVTVRNSATRAVAVPVYYHQRAPPPFS